MQSNTPNKKEPALHLIGRFREWMRGSALRYGGSMLSVCLSVAIAFLSPLLVSGVVDAITDTIGGHPEAALRLPQPFGAWFDRLGNAGWLVSHIWLPALAILALHMLHGLFTYLRGRWSAQASEAIAERLRNALYDHLQRMSYAWHAHAETGDLIQRCTTDVETLRRFLASQLNEIVRAVMMIVLAITLMSGIHGRLTLISVLLMPLMFCLAMWFFHWVQKLFGEADAADGALSAMLQESLTGVRVVRAFGRQRYERDRFDVCADDVYEKSVRIGSVMAIYWSGSDMMGMLQEGLTLLFGIMFALRGEITTGNVIVFVSYISMLIWPIRQLGRILSDLGKALVSLRRIYEILDAPPEGETPGAIDCPLNGAVSFEHVSFAYEDGRTVLDDVNFTVQPGETVAILGATGSGKSTMMHLLDRLYEVTGGAITIGGRDIRTIKKSCLRSRIGYVLQEPFLYARSIRDNIAITCPDADLKSVRAIADVTASDGFIREFEAGYDTLVGERGVTLSGGQKQRVAIARTLMRDNDILVLDDSLSAVDTETDRRIREALQKRAAGRRPVTTFIISHRVTTLADADRILVLENGKIVQQGSHAELIAQDGLYRRVYRIQAALEDELRQEQTGSAPA